MKNTEDYLEEFVLNFNKPREYELKLELNRGLNILIGSNSAGKTLLLNNIADAFNEEFSELIVGYFDYAGRFSANGEDNPKKRILKHPAIKDLKKRFKDILKKEFEIVKYRSEGIARIESLLRILCFCTEYRHKKPVLILVDDLDSHLSGAFTKLAAEWALVLAEQNIQLLLVLRTYPVLEYVGLLAKAANITVKYHSLYKENNIIKVNSVEDYYAIEPNAVDAVYSDLLDMDINQALGGLGK